MKKVILFVLLCATIIACKPYQVIGEFHDGRAIVTMNSQYGYINDQNEIVIPCIYEHAYNFVDGKAVVKSEGQFGIIDTLGNCLLAPVYSSISFPVEQDSIGVNVNKKKKYDADVPSSGNKYIVVRQKDSLVGYYDTSMNRIVPCLYTNIVLVNPDDLCCCVSKNNKWGLYTIGEGESVKPSYDMIRPFADGYAVAEKKQQHYVIRQKDKKVTNVSKRPKYEIMGHDRERVLFKKENLYGFMNNRGDVILDAVYDELRPSNNIYYCAAKKNGKWGAIKYSNWDSEKNIPFEYDDIVLIEDSEHVFLVKKNGKWGIATRYNTPVYEFEAISRETDGNSFWGKVDGVYYHCEPLFLAGRTDSRRLPFSYIDLNNPTNNYYRVKKDSKWGVYGMNGVWLLECKYEDTAICKDGTAIYKENGKWWTESSKNGYDGILGAKSCLVVKNKGKYQLLDKADQPYTIDCCGESYSSFDEIIPNSPAFALRKGKEWFIALYDKYNDAFKVNLSTKWNEITSVQYGGRALYESGREGLCFIVYGENNKCCYYVQDWYNNKIKPISKEYDSCQPFDKRFALAIRDGNHCFLSENGNELFCSGITGIDVLNDFSEGLAVVRYVDGRYGYIDETGRNVFACRFYSATPFKDGKAFVLYANEDVGATIDKRGRVISRYESQAYKKKKAANSQVENKPFDSALAWERAMEIQARNTEALLRSRLR